MDQSSIFDSSGYNSDPKPTKSPLQLVHTDAYEYDDLSKLQSDSASRLNLLKSHFGPSPPVINENDMANYNSKLKEPSNDTSLVSPKTPKQSNRNPVIIDSASLYSSGPPISRSDPSSENPTRPVEGIPIEILGSPFYYKTGLPLSPIYHYQQVLSPIPSSPLSTFETPLFSNTSMLNTPFSYRPENTPLSPETPTKTPKQAMCQVPIGNHTHSSAMKGISSTSEHSITAQRLLPNSSKRDLQFTINPEAEPFTPKKQILTHFLTKHQHCASQYLLGKQLTKVSPSKLKSERRGSKSMKHVTDHQDRSPKEQQYVNQLHHSPGNFQGMMHNQILSVHGCHKVPNSNTYQSNKTISLNALQPYYNQMPISVTSRVDTEVYAVIMKNYPYTSYWSSIRNVILESLPGFPLLRVCIFDDHPSNAQNFKDFSNIINEEEVREKRKEGFGTCLLKISGKAEAHLIVDFLKEGRLLLNQKLRGKFPRFHESRETHIDAYIAGIEKKISHYNKKVNVVMEQAKRVDSVQDDNENVVKESGLVGRPCETFSEVTTDFHMENEVHDCNIIGSKEIMSIDWGCVCCNQSNLSSGQVPQTELITGDVETPSNLEGKDNCVSSLINANLKSNQTIVFSASGIGLDKRAEYNLDKDMDSPQGWKVSDNSSHYAYNTCVSRLDSNRKLNYSGKDVTYSNGLTTIVCDREVQSAQDNNVNFGDSRVEQGKGLKLEPGSCRKKEEPSKAGTIAKGTRTVLESKKNENDKETCCDYEHGQTAKWLIENSPNLTFRSALVTQNETTKRAKDKPQEVNKEYEKLGQFDKQHHRQRQGSKEVFKSSYQSLSSFATTTQFQPQSQIRYYPLPSETHTSKLGLQKPALLSMRNCNNSNASSSLQHTTTSLLLAVKLPHTLSQQNKPSHCTPVSDKALVEHGVSFSSISSYSISPSISYPPITLMSNTSNGIPHESASAAPFVKPDMNSGTRTGDAKTSIIDNTSIPASSISRGDHSSRLRNSSAGKVSNTAERTASLPPVRGDKLDRATSKSSFSTKSANSSRSNLNYPSGSKDAQSSRNQIDNELNYFDATSKPTEHPFPDNEESSKDDTQIAPTSNFDTKQLDQEGFNRNVNQTPIYSDSKQHITDSVSPESNNYHGNETGKGENYSSILPSSSENSYKDATQPPFFSSNDELNSEDPQLYSSHHTPSSNEPHISGAPLESNLPDTIPQHYAMYQPINGVQRYTFPPSNEVTDEYYDSEFTQKESRDSSTDEDNGNSKASKKVGGSHQGKSNFDKTSNNIDNNLGPGGGHPTLSYGSGTKNAQPYNYFDDNSGSFNQQGQRYNHHQGQTSNNKSSRGAGYSNYSNYNNYNNYNNYGGYYRNSSNQKSYPRNKTRSTPSPVADTPNIGNTSIALASSTHANLPLPPTFHSNNTGESSGGNYDSGYSYRRRTQKNANNSTSSSGSVFSNTSNQSEMSSPSSSGRTASSAAPFPGSPTAMSPHLYGSGGFLPAQMGFGHGIPFGFNPLASQAGYNGNWGYYRPYGKHGHRHGTSNSDRSMFHIYIGNIPFTTQWQELKDHLRTAGDIYRVEIPESYDGRPKGFALAAYLTQEGAQKAIDTFDQTMFQGRELTVRFDKYGNGPNLQTPSSEGKDDQETLNDGENGTSRSRNDSKVRENNQGGRSSRNSGYYRNNYPNNRNYQHNHYNSRFNNRGFGNYVNNRRGSNQNNAAPYMYYQGFGGFPQGSVSSSYGSISNASSYQGEFAENDSPIPGSGTGTPGTQGFGPSHFSQFLSKPYNNVTPFSPKGGFAQFANPYTGGPGGYSGVPLSYGNTSSPYAVPSSAYDLNYGTGHGTMPNMGMVMGQPMGMNAMAMGMNPMGMDTLGMSMMGMGMAGYDGENEEYSYSAPYIEDDDRYQEEEDYRHEDTHDLQVTEEPESHTKSDEGKPELVERLEALELSRKQNDITPVAGVTK